MGRGISAAKIRRHPEAANRAFDRLDGALNLVLPGSDTHERYADVEEVGLALAIGAGRVPMDAYNPLKPTTLRRLAFFRTNRDLHPRAWEPKSSDDELLGGEVPDALGRFGAFALAKINNLTFTGLDWSYDPSRLAIAPGRIGIAGGRWFGDDMLGMSGAWELHDHVLNPVYLDEFKHEVEQQSPARTADMLAGEIADILEMIRRLHLPFRAHEIDRSKMDILLGDALTVVHDHLGKTRPKL